MSAIPRLETARLSLRGWCADDFAALAAIHADAEVMRHLGGAQHPDDAWRYLAMMIGQWDLRGYGVWAVIHKDSDALIGRVGMNHPEGWPALEIAWTLGRSYWGQGYASEAADAAMDYAFLTQKSERLISLIAPENIASAKVAARLGEIKGDPVELAVMGRHFTADIWSISRKEWQARKGQ